MTSLRTSVSRSTRGSSGDQLMRRTDAMPLMLPFIGGFMALFFSATLVFAQTDGLFDQFSGQVMGELDQPILVLNQERLLRSSEVGQALLAQENQMKESHQQEGLRLDAELEAEERDLTRKRDELVSEEFEKLAIEFDAKVVAVRRDHQQKSEALAVELEKLRQAFFADIVPIVAGIMQERGASLVFEQRNVLFTGKDVDITQDVIDRLDAENSSE